MVREPFALTAVGLLNPLVTLPISVGLSVTAAPSMACVQERTETNADKKPFVNKEDYG